VLYTLDQLQFTINANPDSWRPLVFTNGCFDLLHPGHVRYLQAAKALGKTLVVGLNSDRSVMTIKPAKPGQPQRPIVTESHRAELLSALRAVDGVVIFDEPTASNLIVATRYLCQRWGLRDRNLTRSSHSSSLRRQNSTNPSRNPHLDYSNYSEDIKASCCC
jgi:rfaE bifunctional protein nucleotidyltransferase chain/domain